MPLTSLADSLAAMEIESTPPAPDVPLRTQWRYIQSAQPVTLSEGGTPLLPMKAGLLLKDEGRNPNGSLQDRVASILLTAARSAGCMHLALPQNSLPADPLSDALAVAIAVYAAHAGVRSTVTLSDAANETDFLRVTAAGALCSRAGEPPAVILTAEERLKAAQLALRALACELAEQMQWKLPETVLLPGATPAEILEFESSFAWLRAQGWVRSLHAPRCIAVHIAPAVNGQDSGAAGAAAQALQKMSETMAIVEEEAVRASLAHWARQGWMLSPGAAAALAFYEQHMPVPGMTVLVNPRSALASTTELARLLRIRRYPGRMPVGGIITPQ